jgi:putative isomerase
MNKTIMLPVFILIMISCSHQNPPVPVPTKSNDNYSQLKKEILHGWNTWNTYSFLSHVHLPDGLSINFYLKDAKSGELLKNTFVWSGVKDKEVIWPGPHAIDGSYTELFIMWKGNAMVIKTATTGDDLVAAVIPADTTDNNGKLVIHPAMLWNKPGEIIRTGNMLSAKISEKMISVNVLSEAGKIDVNDTSYYNISLRKPIYFSTGKPRSEEQIKKVLHDNYEVMETEKEKHGISKDAYDAMQTIMAWNVIYDPEKDRMITPVSRMWNTGWGGYVLFCWDNYFASYMYTAVSRRHALANAIEITNEITENGFIPNFAAAGNIKSRDRSQPPVGSMMVKEIYRAFPEKWFLAEVFDKLLSWNRWWPEHRDDKGLLCWGSEPYSMMPNQKTSYEMNNMQAAKYESGLDNSPMYDGIAFDTITHRMKLADVGLTSLYIADCKALADIAMELGKNDIAAELNKRARKYSGSLRKLWNNEEGIFLNQNTGNGELSHRISPTNFYPLIAGVATQDQAETMMKKNFYDSGKFWGEWIMPSIARRDSGYKDNEYWRGRIWAPMNFLVYLGLCNYDLPSARKDMSEKSMNLLMNEWLSKHHVHENYNAETGEGDDNLSSNAYYHWGALLGMIHMIENGQVPKPLSPLNTK